MRRLILALFVLASLVGGENAPRAFADADSPWTPGPAASGDDTYAGFVDAPADGATIAPGAALQITGWVVDRTADGWAGIDDVSVSLNPSGTLLAKGAVGAARPDVANALGNPFFGASGFSATIPSNALPGGPVVLSIAAHTPNKGWWYRLVHVTVQAPQPVLAFTDDPLIVVAAPQPSDVVSLQVQNLTVSGFALDRNGPGAGVGGSGVSHVDMYLDGPLGTGDFLGSPQLGLRSREATGWGPQFGTAGWQLVIHPPQLGADAHELYIYATSATTGLRTLTIAPFKIQ